MATGANHRPCVGYAAVERLFIHLAILADASGEPRSITYRRLRRPGPKHMTLGAPHVE
jgi:hypothetical protein